MCTICGCSSQNKYKVTLNTHNQHIHDHELIRIEQNILAKNNDYAASNRAYFKKNQIFVLNLVASPGAGKTTLLTQTIDRLKDELAISVIEGDQNTHHDAERIRATGVRALQINTGKGCHLDALMIKNAYQALKPHPHSLLLIENVGNLVCPAAFDLGEAHKVVILSITEGEDKPLKYPDMFRAADIMLLTKTDLLPYLEFNVETCLNYAHRVNPDLHIMQLSALNGEGIAEWSQWLVNKVRTTVW